MESSINKALDRDPNLEYYFKNRQEHLEDTAEPEKKQNIGQVQYFIETFVGEFIWSIGLFCVLIKVRDPLTPDIFHFITCAVDEEVHMIWAMFLWLNYKCWLTTEDGKEQNKVIARAFVEVLISLAIMSPYIVIEDWLYCLLFFSFAVVHALYQKQLSLFSVTFAITYYAQNFIVNLVDYFLYRSTYGGYYNDVKFHDMFSYKLLQGVLCLMISVVNSQTMCPTFAIFRENPAVLKKIFKLTFPMCGLMIVTFLYEMTLFDHQTRSTIFKTQITKMFVTIISVYFIFIIRS